MLSNIHILRTLFRNARRVKEEYYAARNEVARLETRREELRQKVASLAQNDFWFWVVWLGLVSGTLTGKVIDKDWTFVVVFIIVVSAALIYRRYNERRDQ